MKKKSCFQKIEIFIYLFAMILVFPFAVSAKTELKMALGDAAGGTQWEVGLRFAKLLENYTKGDITVALFPNGQLGSEQETVQNLRLGTLDFAVVAINNVTPYSPSVGLLTLPYMILDLDEAVMLTQGEIGKEIQRKCIKESGVRILGWAYSGFRVLTNSKRPVRTLQDLKGLVIRVPKNAIMIDTYKSWGINPTPMAWDETFTALQQKVVDGQDNPYITDYVMKFYEVQKYVTNIRYLFSLEPLLIGEAFFQKQSPETQHQILRAARDATEHCRQFIIVTEDSIKKELVKKGMQIFDPDDNEREWIEKAKKQVWPKYYKSIGGKAVVDQALHVLGR